MSEKDFETPMMVQYTKIKNSYPDCLLFFRLGDFYEMFLDDAILAAKILGITLTSRSRGKDGRVPMCGVPFHAVDNYLPKLVREGYKVAICEQVSEPGQGNLVEREVVRIVSSGTILLDNSLDDKVNNFIMTLYKNKDAVGYCFADLSTGHYFLNEHKGDDYKTILGIDIKQFNPVECILSEEQYNDLEILGLLKNSSKMNISPFFEWDEYAGDHASSANFLKDHFNVHSLETFQVDTYTSGVIAGAGLLGYLHHTQKGQIKHINKIQKINTNNYLQLDRSTINNLELINSLRGEEKGQTLLDLLDKTCTSMGARKMKFWLLHPLKDVQEINSRLDIVQYYKEKNDDYAEAIKILRNISDIERLLSKLSIGIGSPKDLLGLKLSLKYSFDVIRSIQKHGFNYLKNFDISIYKSTVNLIEMLENTIDDNPCFDSKNGGFIKNYFSPELDDLRKLLEGSVGWLQNYEEEQRKITGINNLKVTFNKIFGYYIEISKANKQKLPDNYDRKQTLVNAERFSTPELKEKEEAYFSADEKVKQLEYELFLEIVNSVVQCSSEIQEISKIISEIDCLLSFSNVSLKNKYTRPNFNNSKYINVLKGRHPVVENLNEYNEFIPNDTYISSEKPQLIVITGPNMAGKSVYIRQVAIISLLAQMGCFVPAESADLYILDHIFVRSGASDSIHKGLSTFMVEMVEVGYILNNATSDSLIVMDEIGRGTSTYDGISIATAIAEYLVTNFGEYGPMTLFATHYHELQTLEKKFEKVSNMQAVVDHTREEPVFLHKIMSGASSNSYGISVARMAGLPKYVIENAEKKLKEFEIK